MVLLSQPYLIPQVGNNGLQFFNLPPQCCYFVLSVLILGRWTCELFIKGICLKPPHLCNVSIDQPPQSLSHDCRVPHHPCGPILWTIHHLLVPKTSIQDMVEDLSILLHPSCSCTFPLVLQAMTSHNGETKDLVIKFQQGICWKPLPWQLLPQSQ